MTHNRIGITSESDPIRGVFKQRSEVLIETLRTLKKEVGKPIVINLPRFFQSDRRPNDLDIVVPGRSYEAAADLVVNCGFCKLQDSPDPSQSVFIRVLRTVDEPRVCCAPSLRGTTPSGVRRGNLSVRPGVIEPQSEDAESRAGAIVTSSTGSLGGRGFARIHLHADFEHWGLGLTSYDKMVQLCDDFGAYFLPTRELDYWVMTAEWFFRKKPHYQNRILQVMSNLNDEALRQAASGLFDRYLSLLHCLDRLRRSGCDPADWLQLVTLLRELGPRFALLGTVVSKAWHRRPLRGLMRRYGKLIFLMGVDGAGKTSSAESLVQDHRNGGLDCRCEYLGLKKTIVQQLKDNGSGAVSDSPQSQVPAGLVDRLEQRSRLLGGLANLALSVLYAADYAFRIQRIRRFLGRPDRVVLVDRNYYDRLAGPRRLGDSLLYYLLPRPDLVIALTGSADELSRRKPEYTPEALREMQTGLSSALAWLTTKNVPVAVIDTVKNDEAAVRGRMNSLILEENVSVASGQFPVGEKHNYTANLRMLSEDTVKGDEP